MTFFSAQDNGDSQPRKLWQAEGVAYLLAILAHVALWNIYQALPPTAPEPEPLVIEAALVVVPKPQSAAPVAAPAPPQPEVKPPPAPKPPPKVEKPVPKKMDKPIPEPKPKPVVKPVARPTPKPAPREETESAPDEPVREAHHEAPAAAPVEAVRAAPKAAPAESNEYHAGHVSGFGRNNYPRAAKERGWEGTVTLRVHILADGDIGEVIVTSSSGHDLLDEAAVDMVKEAHASPARRGDKPVDSWVVVPYRFHLEHE